MVVSLKLADRLLRERRLTVYLHNVTAGAWELTGNTLPVDPVSDAARMICDHHIRPGRS